MYGLCIPMISLLANDVTHRTNTHALSEMFVPSDLFISEYVEGSSFNKAIEIFNGTGSTVDLSTYVLELYSNGNSSPNAILALSGSLADGEVLVLANPSADGAILAVADVQNGSVVNFNGDDAIALRNNGILVDVFGQIGADPGSEWMGGGIGTQNETLRRLSSISDGDTDGSNPFDPSAEWEGFPQDTFDGLGSHSIAAQGTLYISEYIEGSSFNKALEIYNGTGSTIDLSAFTLELYSNGNASPNASLALSGSLASGDVLVLANPSADAAILAVTDVQDGGVINFNGDDALVLLENGVVVDAFGQIGVDPGSSWPGGGANVTLRRKATVTQGDTDATDAFDASLEWDSFPSNTFDALGVYPDVVANGIGITATDAAKPEGNTGDTDFLFTITRTGDTSSATSVDYAVTSSEAEATDFGGTLPSGTVNFTADETEAVLVISISGDTDNESDESFTVTLSNPTNGEDLNPTSAEGTIQNDDAITPTLDLVINEILADPAADLPGDANGDGVRDSSQDEFVELVNIGAAPLDISGWTLSDGFGLRHTFPANTVLNANQALVVFGGDTPTGSFGGALVQVASTGSLGLNNSGDTVTLNDGVQDVLSETYGGEGGNNQSLTRDPDTTGGFVQHSSANNANGALFSPGTLIDGTPFSGNAIPLPNLVLNELRISNPDTDNNYVELFGDANLSLSGLSLVVVSGEFEPGQVDFAFDLSTASTDANGFFLLADNGIETLIPQTELDGTDLISDFDFFGSPTTFLLVSGFTGTQGADLDLDNDGVFDSGIGTIIDSVSLTDGDATTDVNYSPTVIGPDGNFTAPGIYSLEDGTRNFQQLIFNSFDLDTPGFSNEMDIIQPGETTLIHAIQGTTDTNLLDDEVVTVEAIVVGDFQDGDADESRNLRGFYVQEEDADADDNLLTSEGIFIFEGNGPTANDVNVGDLVKITGTVDEFFGETQLDQISEITILSSGNTLPTPATISLPASGTITDQAGDIAPDLEAYESMLVSFPQTLTITEMFQLDRFNEIRLSEGGRLVQFTQNNAPDVAGFAAHLQSNGARTIVYDDGLSLQNAAIGNLDGFGPVFSTATDIRMGDTIDGLSGILSYQWAGNNASQATWRVRATQNGENTFTKANVRQNTPDAVGGSLKVVSINVLNYFTTLDDETPRNGMPLTAVGQEPRGANDLTAVGINPATAEFDRQTEKLVNALVLLDADVLGLVEIENDFLSGSSGNAIENLVNELNAVLGPNTYDWINPGSQFVSDDAISVGMIYKTTTVSIADGTTIALLTDADLAGLGLGDLPRVFDGPSTNRVPLAVTFEEIATGGVFTAVVNHFKSKGSPGTAPSGDVDNNDGAANGNQTRLNAAIALDTWLDTDPTGSNDPDFIILGDLNAYAEEAPVTFLEGEGYSDLAQFFVGPTAASFVFDGQIGTLDYALASMSLLSQVSGATEWAVNSNEPDAIDYNLDFGRDASIFDGSVPFRNSDHDPIVVGLDLSPTDTTPPVITLLGDNPLTVKVGDAFVDPGATALDDVDGEIPFDDFIVGGDAVDVNTPGTYEITYTVEDNAQNEAQAIRTVIVEEVATLTITRLVLVDAENDVDVMEVTDGGVIDLSMLATEKLTIRAETTDDVESVGFVLSGKIYQRKIENFEPYALFGDQNGDFAGTKFKPGRYRIQATPASRDWLRGKRGSTVSLGFEVIKGQGGDPADIIKTIRIYPNPARSFTKVSFEEPLDVKNIKIYNYFGRLVRKFDGDKVRVGDEYVLDLRYLWRGVYIVVIQDEYGNKVQKRLVIR